jgi:hypothetical protein
MISADLFEMPRQVNPIEAAKEVEKLREGINKANSRPVSYYLDILDAVGSLWANPDHRKKIVPLLTLATDHSRELVELELDAVCQFLKRDYLLEMIEMELGSQEILDKWITKGKLLLRRHPRGLILHNLAGNALIVAPLSIVYGLITKNVALIKASSDEPVFATAFVRSLLSIEPELSDVLSVLQWPGSDQKVYRSIFPLLDGAIHWGGEKSQQAMAALSAEFDVPLIVHGPKFSFSYLDGPVPEKMAQLAEGITRDMVLWEQKACSSPRFVLVRSGSEGADAEALADLLAISLDDASLKWPISRTDVGKGVLVTAQRQQYRLSLGLSGQGRVLGSKNPDGWTVIVSKTMPDSAAINVATGRFIFVCPVSSSAQVLGYLKSYSRYQNKRLQVIAYEGNDLEFINGVTRLGVSRVARIGEMSYPAPGASHDGGYNLNALTTIHSCPELI